MRGYSLGMTKLEIIQGDIITQEVDAIVNAANSSLLGGSGVDGAIHKAGGAEILHECRILGGCKTGEAKATTAGNMPAKHVIHTVGPVWRGGEKDEDVLLSHCHRRSIRAAADLECKSIAFPAISCGVYGYPIEKAAPLALRVTLGAAQEYNLDLVRFVLFSKEDLEVFEKAHAELMGLEYEGSESGR